MHYDPLLAKLVITAETRAAALARADRAIAEFPILGIVTNLRFLQQLVRHPDVRAGRIDTGWIDRHMADLAPGPDDGLPPEIAAVAAIVTGARPAAPGSAARDPGAIPDPWDGMRGWGS